MARLELAHREDGWWITDPKGELDDHGAYDTKGEADEIRRGLERFLKANPKL